MKDLDYFRNKIKAMDFVPMTDEELAIALKKDAEAVDNARLEGIYQTEEERAFFDMMNQERLPMHLQEQLVDEWLADRLSL